MKLPKDWTVWSVHNQAEVAHSLQVMCHFHCNECATTMADWKVTLLSVGARTDRGVVSVQSVEAEQHEKAVELLKAAQGSVKLVVRYTPKVLEEMEARFEKMRSARRRQQHNSYS